MFIAVDTELIKLHKTDSLKGGAMTSTEEQREE
jgi:hypothetical protein